jgi:chromate transporter
VASASAALEVFRVALRLGLTSFGGPIAHLGYFRKEYVERRRWLTEGAYAELVALAQFLPGPASSQVGMGVGWHRAGLAGALAGWLGFTLPSAVLLAACGAFAATGEIRDQPWLRALQLVAVAVVLDAVIGMARRLANRPGTAAVAVAVGVALLLAPRVAWVQVACLAAAGVLGLLLFRRHVDETPAEDLDIRISRRAGVAALVAFGTLLVALPALAGLGVLTALADAMYRAGALVFGGGHVVLPLLEIEVVPDLVGPDAFFAGYGLAQAAPGPLFTFGSYLGQVAGGVPGAVVATIAVFLPGSLILVGVLPFWNRVRTNVGMRAAVTAINAAVVGLLAAAWIDPIVLSAVHGPVEAVFAAALFAGLLLKTPPWAVVAAAVLASPLLGLAT